MRFMIIRKADSDTEAEVMPSTELIEAMTTYNEKLSKAGVLVGGPATTHWEDADALQAGFPALQVDASRRWVDQGRIVTSAGISAGIDMALHLVARLAGRPLAEATARQMDYRWIDA